MSKKDEYLISEFILDKIERNLEEAIQEIRQARDAGKCAGKPSKEERGFTKEYEAFSNLKVGTKIKIIKHDHLIDRSYINFAGETGVISENEVRPNHNENALLQHEQNIFLKLDNHWDDLDEWDNCLVWNIDEFLIGQNKLFCKIETSEDYPKFEIIKEEVCNDQENIRKIKEGK